jgi:histidinol dehydrogenase
MKYINSEDIISGKIKLSRILKEPNNIISKVKNIIDEVKNKGDEAIKNFTFSFDGIKLDNLKVSDDEIKNAIPKIDENLKEAINIAKNNIYKFHRNQLIQEEKIETMEGVICWRKNVPINSVGLYIPGGTAPLFSTLLMLSIPAKIANCPNIIICSPPDRNGTIHPSILYTANLLGLTNIYKIGGAQAIAAMAYGTQTIPKVNKIFGPGNSYVTVAKQLVNIDNTAIDMPAGPSELAIIADNTANPIFIAADLLSQAEHGTDSQVMLIATDKSLIEEVDKNIKLQIEQIPRKDIAQTVLINSFYVVVNNIKDAFKISNIYAPEHLIIAIKDVDKYIDYIDNAGSVFIGNYTPESAGDYASGTNHTLPTNGNANAYSGVSTESFMKKISFQEITKKGIKNLGKTIEIMAENEQLLAHRNAVSLRIKSLDKI